MRGGAGGLRSGRGWGSVLGVMPKIPAENLKDANEVLDPRPLVFDGGEKSAATDPAFYTELPQPDARKRPIPAPLDRIRTRLLEETGDTKIFLSGHVGSGKSTQINRLAANEDIQRAFHVVTLRFEEQEWDDLDGPQVQFRMAAELYQWGKARKLLGKNEKKWKELFGTLEAQIYGPSGIEAKEGSIGLEIDLLIVKLKQDIKLSENRRKHLRELGETQQDLLRDLITALVNDIEQKMAEQGDGRSLLMFVDDMDKVRRAENQANIYDTHLNTLLALPLRVLYTLPTGVHFGDTRGELRKRTEYLYPVRVLRKAKDTLNPEDAFVSEHFGFFPALLRARVAPHLFEEEAVRLAAIYAGGVLRDFLHLLREAILIARYNQFETVDAVTMRDTVADVRLRESPGLYAPDFEALSYVHETNRLPRPEDRRYLDMGRVIECYNGQVWFEVNPLLWPMLDRR